ncbi:MAG: hypothetical protein GTN78_01740 [Gemmatimonadales bacterium]|nr:hypothetical protein [Gemmatimonadales bacterium]
MKRELSPTFAIMVILVAVAVGLLYFMMRYRADQVRWAREKAAARMEAERTRAMMAPIRERRAGRRASRQQRRGAGAEPGRSGAGEQEAGGD